jgi:hypothetical protein
MHLLIRVILTILVAIGISIILVQFKNRSNFPNIIMIPLITALITKFTLGDWDDDYQWTASDIAYWTSIILASYTVVHTADSNSIDLDKY